MQTAIEVEGLTKTYPGGVEAVKGIDFTVRHGEVFGLLGPNGAGKSTTIGMLTTTVRPTHGIARLEGHDVATDPIGARRVSAVVFQEPVVDRGLTGRRNMQIHSRLWRVKHPKIDEIGEAFGLSALLDRAVGSYSGGERRRLEIARALLSEPKVLFLDEPTVGLDPRIRHELLDLIASVRQDSAMSVLVTTHYLDEAERLCDRVAIIHSGRIVALDTPANLLATLGEQILEVRADNSTLALRQLQRAGVAGADAFAVGSTLTIPLHGRSVSEALHAVESAEVATAVTSRSPTLDDVYLQLTGERIAA